MIRVDSQNRKSGSSLPPELVFCFDRDYTISVNPHPEHQAVPLSWVKYLAHDSCYVDVWATGNQSLCEEAAVVGISEAITCWRELTLPADVERYHEYVPPQARKPSRREGLRLIRAIYCEAYDIDISEIQFVVVDDVDLTDLEPEGWTHYFPWEFVEAVETNRAPIQFLEKAETMSDIPLTESECPESFPPIDYDQPKPFRFLFKDQ